MNSSVIGHGTVYTGSADGWTDIGRTEEGTFEWAPVPELAGLDELPFARLESLSMTVTVPPTRAVLRNLHLAHGGRKPLHRCRWCNPRGNPPPLSVDGREYRRRQLARKRRRR